jgi:hypothetical protein
MSHITTRFTSDRDLAGLKINTSASANNSVITNMTKTRNFEKKQRAHSFRSLQWNSARDQLQAAIIFIRFPIKIKPCGLQDPSGAVNKRH